MAYVSPPTTLPAFPDARPARPKTPFPGGRRKRWKDPNRRIYEWDYQHGSVEAYDERGRHEGHSMRGLEIVRNRPIRPIESIHDESHDVGHSCFQHEHR